MKKLLLIIALLISFVATTAVVTSFAAKPTPAKKVTEQKKNVNNKKQDTKKKTTKPAQSAKKTLAKSVTPPSYIKCVGPDNKVAYAPKKDCDNLWNFWNNNKPSAPSNNGGSSNNNQSSSNNNQSNSNSAQEDQPIVVPAPTETPVPSTVPTPTPTTPNENPVPSETPTPTPTETPEPTVILTVTPTPTEAPTPDPTVLSTVTGTVFNDINSNGVKDENEFDISHYQVTLGGGFNYNQTLTDVDGKYTFSAYQGAYQLGIYEGSGSQYVLTTPNNIDLILVQDTVVDFGVKLNPNLPANKMFIERVAVLPCTSSSCAGITTIIVNGVNFADDAVMYLHRTDSEIGNDPRNFQEGDGRTQLVNRVGSTKVISDFQDLPCGNYYAGIYSAKDMKSASSFVYYICHNQALVSY